MAVTMDDEDVQTRKGSPFFRALSAAGAGFTGDEDSNPAPAKLNRIEDDKTAGVRGSSPQADTGPLTPGWNPQRPTIPGTPPFVAPQSTQAQAPSPYQSLSDQIANEQNEYGRMTAKPTLKQRIFGSLRDAGLGFQDPEYVQQERSREQQMKENLAGRISADTRTLTQEQLADERMKQQAQIEAARRAEDWDKTRALIEGRQGVATTQAGSREAVATTAAGSRENVADTAAGARRDVADTMADARIQAAKIAAANKSEPGSYLPVPDTAGNIVGYINPKSQHYVSASDIPRAGAQATGTPGAALPPKLSGQTQSRVDQARAIDRGANNLISDLRARASHVGNWQNFWKQLVSGTPMADPDQNYLANQLMSFAALQPAAHGARGLQAIQSFEDSIGGTPTSLEALIAGIQGIQRGVGALIPPAPTPQATGGRGPTPFGAWRQTRGGSSAPR